MNLRHATDGAQEPIVDEVGRKKKTCTYYMHMYYYGIKQMFVASPPYLCVCASVRALLRDWVLFT
ncbi:hypothetical protein OUZ56_032266 [Daphnia magna]|uniref:Uncharacterized protein n=1 Tax=Daphnia magna TaxID=35525 RepID=A0ABQ9ZXN5_9CRUS|nr:hypothetical protein OUZ56_032266 [Daphnia magna]